MGEYQPVVCAQSRDALVQICLCPGLQYYLLPINTYAEVPLVMVDVRQSSR